jgi:hypothetical protein
MYKLARRRENRMRNMIIAFAVVLAAGSAAASEEIDVMAPVHQFIDAVNQGDAKTALAACAAQASILDESLETVLTP